MTSQIPKRIKLIVNKGQHLQLIRSSKTLKTQPKKWRVLFLGVVEKMATATVESDTGNPEWLCEITVTCKNPEDPISMLVTDSKGHHIGQVIIPLVSIPSRAINENQPNGRPPLLLSNLLKSELEPTKKNANSKGYLYYWMWAEDYWLPDEITKLKIKKSLSRSMHNLSNSTLNLFRRKKSSTSYQGSHQTYNKSNEGNPFDNYNESGQKASPVKVNHLKQLNHKSGSDTSSSTYNSQMPSSSGTVPNSPMTNGHHSKNPFETLTTAVDISFENNINHQERYELNNQPCLSHQTSVCSKESPVYKKRTGLFSKFRGKKSKSSVDLSKMNSESETRPNPVPQSLGKQQGNRLFEKKNEISKSTADITTWFFGETPLQDNRMRSGTCDSTTTSRPQSGLIHSNSDLNAININTPLSNNNEYNGEHRNNYKPAINLNRNFSLNAPPISNSLLSTYNNYEDKNKRELIDTIFSLENQLKVSSDKIRVSDSENVKLRNEKKLLQDELSTVRDELCKLKFKLLEAGDTKYLEKSRADEISEMALWRANSKI